MRRHSAAFRFLLLVIVFAVVGVCSFLFLSQGGLAPYRIPQGSRRVVANDTQVLASGAYLASIGDCVACHTSRGGTAFAGGRAFVTDYGAIYSSNLTPDTNDGLGDWSPDEFAHTMRNGVSRHGVLYPVFPYMHFALLADTDLDALYAYLHSLPASAATVQPNRLEFPASWRPALIAWRMLYYRPVADTLSSDRGRYLVDGLGHCAMCHSTRGPRGSLPPSGYLAGGRIPGMGWYAPPLDSRQLQRYSIEELVAYLRTGTSNVGAAYGPMAEVVYASLQALTHDDATTIARYLKSVPPHKSENSPLARNAVTPARDNQSISGAEVYKRACADCHGADGEGVDEKYPPLRNSVAATAPDPINAVRIVLYGALPPATAGNPRPYSMPPFVQHLSSAEIAAVVNHMRSTWGEEFSALAAIDIESMYGIAIY